MKLISISGLDGSGKSTQIELLKNYLESQGKKVFYFHAVQFSVANIFLGHSEQSEESQNITARDINTGSFAKAQDDNTAKSVTSASWLKIQLRKVALSIDLLRFVLLRNKLRNSNYDYILSDRYFYDNIININYLSHQSYVSSVDFIPRPDFAFYLQINPSEIIKRDRVPDQGIEYLNKKKILLDQAAASWDLKIINGNRDKEEIFEEIRNIVS